MVATHHVIFFFFFFFRGASGACLPFLSDALIEPFGSTAGCAATSAAAAPFRFFSGRAVDPFAPFVAMDSAGAAAPAVSS